MENLLNSNYFFYFLFFLLSLLILNKLLLPGYVLTLDMVWPTKFKIREFFGWNEIYNGIAEKMIAHLPLRVFYFFLNFIIPSWLIQKLILISIFFLCGVGAYGLCPTKNKFSKFFAGILYTVNPFTYIRFLAGQYGVLFGYALLPFALKYCLEFVRKKSWRCSLKLSLVLALFPAILALHYLLVSLAFLLLFFFTALAEEKKKDALMKNFILVVLSFLALSSYWLIPFFELKQPYKLTKVTEADVRFFTTKTSVDFNTLFYTAAMYGFWRSQAYLLPKSLIPFWPLLFIFILFLTVHGFVKQRKNRYAIGLGFFTLLSLILATGVTHQFFSKFYMFLFNEFQIFRSFREPHKLVAVLALSYSYFGGIGLEDLCRAVKRKSRLALSLFLLLTLTVPFVNAFPMLYNGFYGQLESKFYPSIYAEVNDYLNEDKESFNVLYFPWHGYMDYTWSLPQRIANPARTVFDKPIIVGADPMAHFSHPAYDYISFLLLNSKKIRNFGELVKLVNVKYIILDKTSLAPLKPYDFLYNQTDLELVINSDLVVFRNKAKLARVYEANVLPPKSWKGLIEEGAGDMSPLRSKKISPVQYSLEEKPKKRYLIFTQTYSTEWFYDSQRSSKYLSLANFFNATDATRIYWSGFNYYLTGYLISSLSFLIIICSISLRFSKIWRKLASWVIIRE